MRRYILPVILAVAAILITLISWQEIDDNQVAWALFDLGVGLTDGILAYLSWPVRPER